VNLPVDPAAQQSEADPAREDDEAVPASGPPVPPAVDRRTLDEVFGQVLPETTADERAEQGERARRSSDDWYYENRPPHHDR